MFRTRRAQLIYRLSGVLSLIKTPQKSYEMVGELPAANWVDGWRPEFRCIGRRWQSCGWSMDLIELSVKIDPHHWDHWALIHHDCNGQPCKVCGGKICGQEEEDLR